MTTSLPLSNPLQQEESKVSNKKPIYQPSSDGIYPRCVWCNGENYEIAVIEYSKGKVPCASVNACGQYLPAEYIKLGEDEL